LVPFGGTFLVAGLAAVLSVARSAASLASRKKRGSTHPTAVSAVCFDIVLLFFAKNE
jgi:hypothetical protein